MLQNKGKAKLPIGIKVQEESNDLPHGFADKKPWQHTK
jgi:hypothetical protein